jgi:hypothetical protein
MKRWERLIQFGTRISDVAIPAVLAALALNDIWGTPLSSPPFQGPRGVQTAGALLMTIPLGWCPSSQRPRSATDRNPAESSTLKPSLAGVQQS